MHHTIDYVLAASKQSDRNSKAHLCAHQARQPHAIPQCQAPSINHLATTTDNGGLMQYLGNM